MTTSVRSAPFRPPRPIKRQELPLGRARRAAGRLRRRSRLGISIWGVMLGLVVVGIGIASLISMYGSAREGAQHASLNQLVATLRANVERLHAGRSNYVGLTVASLDLAGGVPDSARSDSTLAPGAAALQIVPPVGNTIDVNAWGPAATARNYIIQINEVEQETCAALLRNWVGQRTGRSGIVAIEAAATRQGTFTGTLPGTTNVPLTTANVTTLCTAANEHVRLYFR